MKSLRWIWVGVGFLVLPGCSGSLVAPDIAALLRSDTGRAVLKSVEAHGGIWRWRQRPYVQFDHSVLETSRGMDTVIANRGKDTTITPRLDTVANVHDNCILDIRSGKKYARSASQTPLMESGFNGDSIWSVTGGVPDSSLAHAQAGHLLEETAFLFGLPFSVLDSTLRFSLLGEQKQVDTLLTKGKEPGTFDTTRTEYTISRLKVEWPHGKAPVDWLVLYLDGRDGRVRRTLAPVTLKNGTTSQRLTVWTDLTDVLGLKLGGRRLGYPATADGVITGPAESDVRFYNVDFPRELEGDPFHWSPSRSALNSGPSAVSTPSTS